MASKAPAQQPTAGRRLLPVSSEDIGEPHPGVIRVRTSYHHPRQRHVARHAGHPEPAGSGCPSFSSQRRAGSTVFAGALRVCRYVLAVPPVPPVLPPDPDHESWMQLALEQARASVAHDDVPIGAVVVHHGDDGARIVAARHNERELTGDPTAHAEVLALRDAAEALGRWRLDDCTMVVTLEPCPMCAGALWAARIGAVVFGAENTDAGALGTLYHLGQDPRLNHEFPVRAKVFADESATLLRGFFARRR